MKFKIGDIVRDTTEQDYILYEVTSGTHGEQRRIWIKLVELPNNYDGYLKVGRVYSDYEDRYILIKRIHKGKGYQPEWL